MSWVTWLPKSTIRILSCAEATWGDDDSRAFCAAVMDSRYATGNEAATLWGPSWPGFHVFRADATAIRLCVVIPGRCEASNPESRYSGFALRAPRNDGLCLPAQHRNEKAVGSGSPWRHQPPFGKTQCGFRERLGLIPEHRSRLFRRGNHKLGMACDEGADLPGVLLRQHRAGDVGDPPSRLDHGPRAVQHLDLILDADFQRTGPHPPFRIGVAPPGACPRAGRVDQNEVCGSLDVGYGIIGAPGRAHFGVVDAGARQALMDRR